MRNYICVFLTGSIALVSGCSVLTRTLGETRSGYTYVPIDPFSVEAASTTTTNATSVTLTGSNLFKSLPDNAVRIAVEQFDASGSVTYGPAGVSVKGSNYKVTIDYINADTANVRLFMLKRVEVWSPKRFLEIMTCKGFVRKETRYLSMTEPLPPRTYRGSEHYEVHRIDDRKAQLESTAVTNVVDGKTNVVDKAKIGAEFNIPVYIGIGLRVTAEISTYAGNVNISGLGAIGVAADAKKLSGSLVVQTLGINGKSIAAALPIQSELNQTTVQNAIVAVGAIKSHLYDPETAVAARVVGLYLPFAGGKPLVNAIISELSKEPVEWGGIKN